MKSIYTYMLLGSFICSLATITGCRKLTDINLNPNEASTTHPQALLTRVEWDAFRTWHGTDPLYTLKMIVQTDGENANQIYNWQRAGFEQYGYLRNVGKMAEEAQKIGANNYLALAKFFRAYYFYNLTLTFGDIPYAEAGKGESEKIYAPKYSTQKEVFVGILKELEEAAAILKGNNSVISGDIIYGGSSASWNKLVNSFRLKVLLTLDKKAGDFPFNPATEFAKIYAQEAIISNVNGSEDGQLLFLNQDGNRYPEFNASSYGSGMYMDSTFIQRLQDLKDPRLFVVATQTRLGKEAGKAISDFSAYEGGDPIVPYAQVNAKAVLGKLSKVHERYTQDPTAEPLVMLGCAEVQFILAEALLKGWITGDVNALYAKGVQASFKFYEKYAKNVGTYTGESQAALYLAQDKVSLTAAASSTEKLQRVLMQKYLRSFHQGGYTAYFDHLRTGYPNLRKAGNVKTAYRWMYPQEEYNYNTANVSEAIKAQFNGNDNINLTTWWLK